MSSRQNLFEGMVCEGTGSEEERMPPEKAKESFRNATRIQESFTSALERRVLMWFAARMPFGSMPTI